MLVVKDFDTNQKTRKKKFEGFFGKSGEIVEVLQNNRYRIRVGEEEKVVYGSQIKKIVEILVPKED